VAVAAPSAVGTEDLLAIGVAPERRRAGLATSLLATLVADRPAGTAMRAVVNAAERDVVEPFDVALRMDIADRLLRGAGFEPRQVSPDVRRDDPWAIELVLPPR
jgi:ribosomal protein S18 acetylase RimI-like enzyme